MNDTLTNFERIPRRDAITASASPRPWRVRMETRDIYERRGTFAHIEDANGGTIGTTITPRCDADAAFIVEAVNQYEWANEEIHRLLVEKDAMFDEAVKIREERDRPWPFLPLGADPADLSPTMPGYIPRTTTRREHRAARIRALGNGQVPKCASAAFRIGLALLCS